MNEIAYKCPRCLTYGQRVRKTWLGVEVSANQSRTYQVCPDCNDSLAEWWRKGPEEAKERAKE